MKTEIISYQDQHQEQWDKFVLNNEKACFYHLSAWNDIFKNNFKIKNQSLIAIENSEITGILPLFEMKNIMQQKFLISSPFTNYSGLITNSRDTESLLLAKADEITKKTNSQYCEFRQIKELNLNSPKRDNFVTMKVDISKNLDEIWQNTLQGKVRNQIRKAQKSGLSINKTNNVSSFYKIFKKTMHRLGTPAYSKKFIQSQLDVFISNSYLLEVTKNNVNIAAMLVCHYKDTVYTPLACSLVEYNKYCPTNLMYWEVIKNHHETLKWLDMGRSTANTGTFSYKQSWGAKEFPLHYEYILGKASRPPIVDATNNKYNQIIEAWKKAPSWVVNFLGPKLIKFLPEL